MNEIFRTPILLAALLASTLALGSALAADPKPAPATNTPAFHTIAKGSLKPKVQLDAVFESLDMTPVKLETKAWTDLTVLEAVAHGARVKKGQVLVKLDTEKLVEQIKEQELDAQRVGSVGSVGGVVGVGVGGLGA